MHRRLTHIPLELVDHVPGFIASRGTPLANSMLVRTHNCSTLSLIKTLYALRDGSLSFSDLFRRSEIRLKRSFLGYVSVCIHHKFITKSKSGAFSMYAITPKGLTVLELFVQKSN